MLERLSAIGLVVLAATTPRAAAEQKSVDPIAALLAEVRQLRIVMERSAAVGPRIQLLTSRMALQDERVFRTARQVDSLRDELQRLTTQSQELAARTTQLEEALRTATDPGKQLELREALRFVKTEAELQATREQQTRAREAEAASALAQEQARWTELSQRLDDIEALLDKP